ncbi:glycosyltransferase family 4 protein [[Ruminococcus] torques]|uniref:glycosyltransferase family 4 protein n=1 Tax=[Ruminococcus] torques TaxID=33039 RepID=UPI0025A3E308|nr:glycosyltransferase family 4 protein [[Ruminococcus] torques]MDM8236970.1 glycosyltransferase family 4 protein [[Ruminococcus] torques]
MKIVIAHPGQQHSYQLAAAIKRQGCLYRYITTFYAFQKKGTLLRKIPLFKSFTSRMLNRRCKELDDTDIETFGELGFLVVAFLLRCDKKGNLYRKVNCWLSHWFGRKVARYAIKNHVDAVVMYDTNAATCFSVLKKRAPQIIRIQDVSAINRLYMKNIYEEDMKRSPQSAKHLMSERGFLFEKRYQEEWQKEINLSNYFIVPSEIVSKSLIFSGARREHIFKCPYGTNFEVIRRKHITKKTIEVLYIGNITQMKGISYLLEAISRLPDEKFHLTMVGKFDESWELLKKYKNKVHFVGYVMHEKLQSYLEMADVFVFPSLGDSFGLVVLEALSYGLPVICTDHAGAADAITNGENGFVVPAGSAEAIEEKLVYCYEHPDFLLAAREKAYDTAEKYTWARYQNDIGEVIEYLCRERKKDDETNICGSYTIQFDSSYRVGTKRR